VGVRPALRPTCPKHPGSKIQLDGYKAAKWTKAYRRPRYRCLGDLAAFPRGHVFTLDVTVRQPTDHHPDGIDGCAHCDHSYERHEGIRTGTDFIFGHNEIARLLMRVGEGISLRDASRDLRVSIVRNDSRATTKSGRKIIRAGAASRQANLAVNYLDTYGAAVVNALAPTQWPRVLVLDSTTLMRRGMRPPTEKEIGGGADPNEEVVAGNLKAGTILVGMDATGAAVKPCLIQVQGGKDTDAWKAFFSTLTGAPDWVIADLDGAIARAVRETWPKAILYHSRYHLAARMRVYAKEDGVPDTVKLDEPIERKRPSSWSKSGSKLKRYGPHPLFDAITEAQRGPDEWAVLLAAIDEHVPHDKLALRSWIATNDVLISRQWRIIEKYGRVPLSTGALEGKVMEWLSALHRRGGRWTNARRLNLVLGLMMLRGRGDAREERYAGLIRRHFAARQNRSHLPAENTLPVITNGGTQRQMSWWRSWQDRDDQGPRSLPSLVFASDARVLKRDSDDHVQATRERLAEQYAQDEIKRRVLGQPIPPRGRPKQPEWAKRESLVGVWLRDIEQLMLEWDYDVNGDIDPNELRATSKERVAWRCLVNPDHTWEAKVYRRAYGQQCPYHMGNRVHPSESFAFFYPDLVAEWHPSKNVLKPEQVTRASGETINWICRLGHEWPAPVYSRTIHMSGCDDCQRLTQKERSKLAAKRSREKADARAEAQLEEKALSAVVAEDDLPF
jgi:hypothetical protein